MRRALVVGAGLGGLSAAIRLAGRGFRVTVLEKNETAGGKMGRWEEGGFVFDTGPTLLTMPFVLRDLFREAGGDLDAELLLEPVDPVCRYAFADGSVFRAWRDPAALDAEVERLSPRDVAGVRRLLDHGERIYRASEEPFLGTAFGSWSAATLRRAVRFLPSVRRLDAFRTLDAAVSSFVMDQRLRQMFNRFATYNGSSPYRAPATLAIIPYVEMRLGGWTVRGGMYEIARALLRLAASAGVEIRYGREVRRVLRRGRTATGVECMDGERVEAPVVIINEDAVTARRELLGSSGRLPAPEPSMSGLVILLGVGRRYPSLAHHNIFFSADYRTEFRELLDAALPASEPTIYVSAGPSAPQGSTALFVLVNAPALPATWSPASPVTSTPWADDAYAGHILRMLEDRGLEGLRNETKVMRTITPVDFALRFNAYRGALYGSASNSRMSAFLRTPNVSRTLRGVYFVGGSTHPGGGIPLVLLSGRIVADMISGGGGVV